jgi:hypothetical protein
MRRFLGLGLLLSCLFLIAVGCRRDPPKDPTTGNLVLLYLGDFLNEALKPVLKSTLKPGARVVSHRFLMGADWPPDETRKLTAKNNHGESEEYLLHIWTIK